MLRGLTLFVLLEEIFDRLDGHLGVVEPQGRHVVGRYVQMFHDMILLIL